MILYEYPLNERIRTYLRLEHLFSRLSQLMSRSDALDHHYAIATIFDIVDVACRADMKSEVLKDIERQKLQLHQYRGNPAISERVLEDCMSQLDERFMALNAVGGKTGQCLSESDWLMSIRSRIGIAAGTCEFDLPAYFDWQHRSAEHRRANLHRWSASLMPLGDAIGFLLGMLRSSGSPQKVIALNGQFQQNLPQGRTFQLLRLSVDAEQGLVPEISGNRLMFLVRLLHLGNDEKMHPVRTDATFEMTLCASGF